MTAAHYIIHRVNLDIEAPDEPVARQMQDDAARLFHNWIVPKLEELLDWLVPKDVVLRLNTIDLVLDPLDPAGFESNFGELLLSRFQEKIEGALTMVTGTPAEEPPEQSSVMTAEERIFSTFLYFLATGQLPWWSEQTSAILEEAALETVLTHLLQIELETVSRLIALLASETRAVERLLLQFSPPFVDRLVQLLLKSSADAQGDEFGKLVTPVLVQLATSAQTMTATDLHLQRDVIQMLMQWLHNTRTSTSSRLPLQLFTSQQLHAYTRDLLCRLQQRTPNSTDQPLPPSDLQPTAPLHRPAEVTPGRSVEQQEAVEENGMHVTHAGLVLLHPFLEYFFREFQLLDGQGFRDAAARTLAVHLLQYLATGQETPPEYLLTMEKFLCGAELPVPIPRAIQLTAHMKEESDTLLRAAIGHWKVLKNTSPAGLREGFLQRPGKLISNTLENRLIVEAKAHDVLLNYLPWGYGIIKLPWLSQPLLVDWHS